MTKSLYFTGKIKDVWTWLPQFMTTVQQGGEEKPSGKKAQCVLYYSRYTGSIDKSDGQMEAYYNGRTRIKKFYFKLSCTSIILFVSIPPNCIKNWRYPGQTALLICSFWESYWTKSYRNSRNIIPMSWKTFTKAYSYADGWFQQVTRRASQGCVMCAIKKDFRRKVVTDTQTVGSASM